MIQVLNRSFKILEYMSEEPNKAYTLSEIAELIDVSPSTCSHIMKTMEINDYVEKPASRKGYRLGPKPYYLTRKGPYRKDLIISAEPYVEELAEKIKETIVLSIITRSKNYNLIKIDGDQLIQLNEAKIENVYLSSIFSTATGMLLLSYLNKSERKAIIQREGIPEEKFRTREDLMKEIDRIREQSYVVNETSRGEIIQIAFPIKNKDEVVAALGVSLPRYRFKQNRQKILEFTKKWQRRQVFLYILEKVVTKRGVNYESGKTQYSYDNDRSASSRYDDLCR